MPYQPGVTGEQPQGVAGKRPRRNAVRGTSTLVEGDGRRVGDLRGGRSLGPPNGTWGLRGGHRVNRREGSTVRRDPQ